MFDLVISGGDVVDGTGAPRRPADVGIEGDRITEVGDLSGRAARRRIEADGALVTPGWVDIHTHYDGQATWDPMMAPSSLHGVTSVVMGNCGVGFAPARQGEAAHDFLIALMEGVEDIPGTALHEGLPWDWESFPQYLDSVASRPHAIDIGSMLPHAALRAYVMGERGANYKEDARPEEIAEMTRLTIEALEAGAIGVGTSRTVNHRSRTGAKIGTLTASNEELLGIAEGLRHTGKGVLQFVSDFKGLDDELALMRRAAEMAGRPLSVSLVQADPDPDRWRRVVDHLARAQADGIDMKAQVACRPVGLLVGLHGSMHPFVRTPSWMTLADLPLAEQVARMRDPELRARLLAEARDVRGGLYAVVARQPHKLYRLGDPPRYEPDPAESLAAEAQRRGIEDPMELVYDVLLERAGTEMLYVPAANFAGSTLDAAREMLLSEWCLPGLSDGGAHVSFICDASFPTFLLTHWCRDRTRGEKLPLELAVKRQTHDTARHIGWLDRGVVAPGYLADLNVIDFDRLQLRPPTMINDLPAGGRRLMQRADGYRHTVKRGEVSFDEGEHTGVLNGTLVRGAQAGPA
ncbi:MAG: amidohydrolase family protein [Acidimicrobiia bacterium]|nr:amidohydrolase family protein [Acidimicrobiia bacterium]